jgi:hydrogenase nickel incorporation protein HypA/HybF
VHELSISYAIAEVVLRHAGDRTVRSVQVRVGALRQIVPDSLTLCWSIVSRPPQLQGSQLNIEHVPGRIECSQCGVLSTLTDFSLSCPACGNGFIRVVSGDEFLVDSIDVAPREATAHHPTAAFTHERPAGESVDASARESTKE